MGWFVAQIFLSKNTTFLNVLSEVISFVIKTKHFPSFKSPIAEVQEVKSLMIVQATALVIGRGWRVGGALPSAGSRSLCFSFP